MTEVRISLNRSPLPATERDAIVDNPVFGQSFTNHMVTMRFTDGHWSDLELTPFGPMSLSPATLALHYGQSIFEALKAYRLADGSPALFRPSSNAARMAASATRIAMPELPADAFETACALLVEADRDWIPDADGAALYVRPFMFASEPHLSVRPATEYMFVVIACPVASYFDSGASAITVAVESRDVRATAGGTGAAKFSGNYAAGFAAHGRAGQAGHDQVMWLDAAEHRWVEELNAMNVMFVWNRSGRTVLSTPPLTGTILGGVTRESLLRLAADLDPKGPGAAGSRPAGTLVYQVTEERVSIDMIRSGIAEGSLLEIFACGTAAVIAPIGRLVIDDETLTVGSGGPGEVTMGLRQRLLDVQHGRVADTHGWMTRVDTALSSSGIDPRSLHLDH
ncbi:MAG: branched-chain amino acid aminotransferase [Microthrixaceae bacterium]